MNESCGRCRHQRPSHDQWGEGPCAAVGCKCDAYIPPNPWAPEIGRELRENGWQPRRVYPCGCDPEALCPDHARQRAVEQYHPEATR